MSDNAPAIGERRKLVHRGGIARVPLRQWLTEDAQAGDAAVRLDLQLQPVDRVGMLDRDAMVGVWTERFDI